MVLILDLLGFAEIKGPFAGAPTTRITWFWTAYEGDPVFGNSNVKCGHDRKLLQKLPLQKPCLISTLTSWRCSEAAQPLNAAVALRKSSNERIPSAKWQILDALDDTEKRAES